MAAAGDTADRYIGARLRTARESADLLQADVAKVLKKPRTTVSAIEAGRRRVTAAELLVLARLYLCSVDWLLGDDAIPEAEDALLRVTRELPDDALQQVIRYATFLLGGG